MRNSRFGWYALSASIVASLLAGCGVGSPSSPAPGAVNQTASMSAVNASRGATAAVQPDRGASWMDPDARKSDLTYIADQGTNDVYVYAAAKLVGTLKGFNEPSGECVDKAGDVLVTNFGASNIVEYAHGAKKPIQTLSDPGFLPLGCSIDPTTGNLAVTNRVDTQFSDGNLVVYADAQGAPTSYTNSNIYYYEFCGYDAQGNLYMDGLTPAYVFTFAELPKGSSSLQTVTLNQTIGYPGGVQWDGKHVAVGDQNVPEIYQFAVSAGAGTQVGSTTLTGGSQVTQFWIQGSGKHARVIGPNAGGANTMYWNYPAGGSPTRTIAGSEPVGVTVSLTR